MRPKRHSSNALNQERPSLTSVPRDVLDDLLEGCQLIDRQWRYIYVNNAVAEQGRLTKEQLVGRTMMEVYPGIQGTPMFAVLRRCMEERTASRMENEFTFPDGAKGWFELSFEPVAEGVFILSMDITGRKRAQEALRRSNRALRMLSECNEAIIKASDENTLLKELSGIAVETCGYLGASVGLAQGDMSEIRPVAHAGIAESETEGVHRGDLLWDGGPSESAGRAGKATVVHVTSEGEEYAGWRQEALKRKVASCLALPLRAGDKVIGVLTVYSGEPDAFNGNEMSLLVEMASDLSYGLVAVRTAIAHRKAEARIVHLNSVLRGIRGVNQLLTRERDPRAMIRRTCELLVESRGFNSCVVVLTENGRPRASELAGEPKRLSKLREILGRGELPDCMKRAISGSDLVVRENAVAECPGCPVNDDYTAERDAVAVRLESEGTVYGALLVSMPAGSASEPQERGLLREVAGDLAFALRSAELRGERDAAVEDLRATKEHLQAMVQASPAAILSLDPEGRILTWNHGAEMMFGWTAPEVIGKPSPIVPPDKQAEFGESRRRILLGESFSGIELERIRKNGTRIWVAVSTAPLKDRESHAVGIMAVALDLTERKRAEEQLRETNEKLLQAQKMEAVGRLAGGVAHDFNNILTAIYGYCDILLAKVPDVQAEHSFVAEIRKAAVRAASLTQQLLAFSRRQTLQPKVVNLNDLVHNLQNMLGRMIGEDIDLKLALADSVWAVKVDPARIEQALMNLAVNARDAMPQGGKLLIETQNARLGTDYVQSHPEAVEGEYAMVAVSDSGIGMNKETQSHLFEPFFTTKEPSKGTGLGLSTVYGIVKQSGGSIWVYSEVEKGTTFKIYLPHVEEEPVPLPVAEGAPLEDVRGHETILYVEDDEAVRTFVTLVLREHGYTVLAAANGEEAIRDSALVIGTVDLMITDVVMPRMNGRELVERMLKINPALRVVYTSGYTSNTIAHHNVLDQGIELIEKPVSADELLRKIRGILDR